MIVIEDISSEPEWEGIFSIILEECDAYQVNYPSGVFDKENPLMSGMSYFMELKDIKVEPWEMMEESLKITGKLNNEIKSKIYGFIKPSFSGDKPDLWDFSLLKNNIQYLRCSDFTVCILEDNDEIKNLLQKKGLNRIIE
ncbi:hypothetical protein H5P36_06945 [Bacillus sp. APMAM]|nr:hypothetical protein [Bacillus sp. APMAM]RTZ56616.1 hypothetical protein EKO25_06600 [Bacillus sp. SAJ1]